MDIDNLQSANVPSLCSDIQKTPPKPSYSLPCFAPFQATELRSRVLCKIVRVLVGKHPSQKLRTTDTLQHYELKINGKERSHR